MSKLTIYAILSCYSLTMAFGTESVAQRKLLEEISIEINYTESDLIGFLKEIEKNSDFSFVYTKKELLNKKVDLEKGRWNMSDLMYSISSQAHVSIKRVNEFISIKGLRSDVKSPNVTEEIEQPIMVTGTITDENGEALPGAAVQEKGTSNGTITDVEGKFQLNVDDAATLLISFVGYQSKEMAVNGQSVINTSLELDVTSLGEVVIVDYGYGSVKKSDFTGSVASIGSKELSKIPTANAAQALAGRLPGVSVRTTDGSPSAEVVIRVRGGGSITQSNDPLFVVDGLIVSDINNIPTTDIESLTVLKDASATAIYGAQAANGVVVVTTKGAEAGKTTISYNGFGQFNFLPQDRKLEVLSPYEYVMVNYEMAKLRSESNLRNFEKYFGTYQDLELYKFRAGTNWQDELFGDAQVSQAHNLSFTGGSESTKYSLSLSNNVQEGILPGNSFDRNVINLKLNHKVSDKLTLDATARLTNSLRKGAGTSGNAQLSIKDAVQTRPVNGIADELEIDLTTASSDDDYATFLATLINPVELLKQDWRRRKENEYVLSAALNWEIIKNLNAKTTISSITKFVEDLRFYGPLTGESFNNGGNLPIGQKTDSEGNTLRWLNTVSYTMPALGSHSLTILGGHEIYQSTGERQFVRGEDYRESITPEDLFANMTFGRVDRHETSEAFPALRVSLFGRVDYQFMNRYLATFTVRSDASSKFSKENRLGVFPAMAIAWKLSEEDFLEGSSIVDDLKIRASIGETGNDRIDNEAAVFLFQGSTLRGPGFNNVDNPYYTPSSDVLYNPDLVWETTINRNAGIDFSLLKARVNGALDLYYNTTKDLLLQSAIPSNTGFNYQWDNQGSTSNKGIELALNGFIIDSDDFSLSVNTNFGINRAKIEELDGTNDRFYQSNWASTDLRDRDDFYLEVGGTVGDVYGYVTDGYYTTDDFSGYESGSYILKEGVANSSPTVGNTAIRPGFLKLKDLNGDSLITSADRTVIGNTLPKAQGGFGFDARYKGFDASIFFNWSYGNDIYNADKIQFTQMRRITYGNLLNTMNSDNRFTYIDVNGTYTDAPGEVVTDLNDLAELNAGKNIWSPYSHGVAGAVIHSWAIEDGSFIRLNQLSLGYSLPQKLISKLKMSQFRIYLTGNNLHVWTKYSGFDPEVSTSRSSSYPALTPGVDYSSFPRGRSYTVGANITF